LHFFYAGIASSNDEKFTFVKDIHTACTVPTEKDENLFLRAVNK